MGKPLTRNRVEIITIFIFLGIWLVSELLFQLVIPQYYFAFFPVTIVIFMLMTLIMTNCIRRWERKLYAGEITRAKAFNNFMIGKTIKLVTCLAIIICYIKLIGDRPTTFLVSFMILYLIFLVMETAAQYNFEKRYKLWYEENKLRQVTAAPDSREQEKTEE